MRRWAAMLALAAAGRADVSGTGTPGHWIVFTMHQESSEQHELWLLRPDGASHSR